MDTHSEMDRRSGSEVKEQRAEEAFRTPGHEGIVDERSEERKRGWRAQGAERLHTAALWP